MSRSEVRTPPRLALAAFLVLAADLAIGVHLVLTEISSEGWASTQPVKQQAALPPLPISQAPLLPSDETAGDPR